MEAILFVGLPGSGKSSFYKDRFFNSHVRISIDLLKTRHRETRLLKACLETDQRLVIEKVIARRRRIRTDFGLPMKDEYGQFVRSLIFQTQAKELHNGYVIR